MSEAFTQNIFFIEIVQNHETSFYFQEPNNLTNLSSYRYNGLVHKKTVGIVDAPDKKGFTVVYKKSSKQVITIVNKIFAITIFFV